MGTSIFNARQKIDNVNIGKDVILCDFINLYECSIGERTKIGTFVEIQRGASIGSDCKIQSHTFICEGVHIGNGVFIGHNVSFINDKHPKAVNDEGNMISLQDEWEMSEINVEDGASIGTSATIMGGCSIGKNAVVGAGAMVLQDVPAGTTVVGNPARIIKRRE